MSAWVSWVICLAFSAPGAATPAVRVGVFDVSLSGIEASVKTSAIDAIATAAAALPGATVVTKSELESMLGAERLKDSVGCSDVSCLAEIGAAAGVDRVIAGSVARLEGEVTISLQLINSRYATVENRVTLSWNGGLGRLPDVLGAAVELLLLPVKQRKPGSLRISTVPADALVYLDDVIKGSGPLTIEGATVGVHRVRVDARGYEPWSTAVVVRHGQSAPVPISLIEKKESPFYTKWYFWTPIAAVVAGGVVTAAVLATRPKSTPGADQLGGGTFATPTLPAGVAR